MNEFAHAFSTIQAIGAICGFIFAVFLWSAYRTQAISQQLIRDIQSASRKLDAETPSNKTAVIEWLSEAPTTPIATALRASSKGLVFFEGCLRTPNTRPISSYFIDIASEYADIRSIEAMPNVLIGIGLFFTFFGLTLSLLAAAQGGNTADIETVKRSVGDLLNFAALKFASSLVALLLSIYLGIMQRRLRHSADAQLVKLTAKLEDSFPPLSMEELALHTIQPDFRKEQLDQATRAMLAGIEGSDWLQEFGEGFATLLEESKEQTVALKSFNTDLATQLGAALDSRLQPMLTNAVDKLESALREMGAQFSAPNESALQSVLQSFMNELRGTTQLDAQDLQRNIQQLAENLSNVSNDLTTRMSDMFQSFEATATSFGTSLSSSSGAFSEEMRDAQSNLSRTLYSSVETLASQAKSSQDQFDRLIARLDDGADRFRETVATGAASFVSEMTRGSDAVDGVVKDLLTGVVALDQVISRVREASTSAMKGVDDRIDHLREAIMEVEESFHHLASAAEPFTSSAKEIHLAIEGMRSATRSTQDQLSEVSGTARALSDSSERLMRDIDDKLASFSKIATDQSGRLTDALSSIAARGEKLGDSLTASLETTLSAYEKRFAGIDAELSKAFDGIVTRFTATYEEIRQRVDIVDSQMASAVKSLAQFNESLTENIEDLSDAIQRLPPAPNGHAG
jgi:ABC-type transporter Mla subunit MlaD